MVESGGDEHNSYDHECYKGHYEGQGHHAAAVHLLPRPLPALDRGLAYLAVRVRLGWVEGVHGHRRICRRRRRRRRLGPGKGRPSLRVGAAAEVLVLLVLVLVVVATLAPFGVVLRDGRVCF